MPSIIKISSGTLDFDDFNSDTSNLYSGSAGKTLSMSMGLATSQVNTYWVRKDYGYAAIVTARVKKLTTRAPGVLLLDSETTDPGSGNGYRLSIASGGTWALYAYDSGSPSTPNTSNGNDIPSVGSFGMVRLWREGTTIYGRTGTTSLGNLLQITDDPNHNTGYGGIYFCNEATPEIDWVRYNTSYWITINNVPAGWYVQAEDPNGLTMNGYSYVDSASINISSLVWPLAKISVWDGFPGVGTKKAELTSSISDNMCGGDGFSYLSAIPAPNALDAVASMYPVAVVATKGVTLISAPTMSASALARTGLYVYIERSLVNNTSYNLVGVSPLVDSGWVDIYDFPDATNVYYRSRTSVDGYFSQYTSEVLVAYEDPSPVTVVPLTTVTASCIAPAVRIEKNITIGVMTANATAVETPAVTTTGLCICAISVVATASAAMRVPVILTANFQIFAMQDGNHIDVSWTVINYGVYNRTVLSNTFSANASCPVGTVSTTTKSRTVVSAYVVANALAYPALVIAQQAEGYGCTKPTTTSEISGLVLNSSYNGRTFENVLFTGWNGNPSQESAAVIRMSLQNGAADVHDITFKNCVIKTLPSSAGRGNAVHFLNFSTTGTQFYNINFDHCWFEPQPRMQIEVNGRGGYWHGMTINHCTFENSGWQAVSFDVSATGGDAVPPNNGMLVNGVWRGVEDVHVTNCDMQGCGFVTVNGIAPYIYSSYSEFRAVWPNPTNGTGWCTYVNNKHGRTRNGTWMNLNYVSLCKGVKFIGNLYDYSYNPSGLTPAIGGNGPVIGGFDDCLWQDNTWIMGTLANEPAAFIINTGSVVGNNNTFVREHYTKSSGSIGGVCSMPFTNSTYTDCHFHLPKSVTFQSSASGTGCVFDNGHTGGTFT